MENEKEFVKLPYFGLNKLIPYLKPYKGTILAMCLAGVLTSAVDIVFPLFQKYAIDNFVADNALGGLLPFTVFYLLFLLLQVAANFVSCYNAGKIEMYVGRDMKKASFDHLQTLSFSYFNRNSVGYLHARVMSDTSRIGGLVSWSLMDGVWHCTYIVGAIAVMFVQNFRLACIVVAVVPVLSLAIAYFQKKLVVLSRKIREINSRITGKFNEGITGAKTVKTLVMEEKTEKDFVEVSGEMKKTSLTAAKYRSLFVSVSSFAGWLALALVLWQGGKLTGEQAVELGTLSVFMTYAINMMDPIQWVVKAISDLITVQVNVERFTKLTETESDVADTEEVREKYGDTFNPKKENWEELKGDIEFEDVSFKYPDGEEYVLEHFNLKVPQGTNVAIVGETGAGKSTLVNLVCRFFEPTEGRILIDGRDARERSQLWLHSQIGYVLQTPHLFSGTVRENLLYGREDATDEELMNALESVAATEIVERMDKGLDSDVGEGGDLLSTGEKQLISFARAILAKPKIFVLDEATSSVDTVTEKKIQDAIASLMKGRTSFMIAHRLSTVRQADVILVVDKGKIVERGTHGELLKMHGRYYDLYTRQYQEEVLDGKI